MRSLVRDRGVIAERQLAEPLIELGVVVMTDGLPRRALLLAGVCGIGAGLAVLALPTPAAAQSGPEAIDYDGDPFPGLYGSSVGGWLFQIAFTSLPDGTSMNSLDVANLPLTVDLGGSSRVGSPAENSFGFPEWTFASGQIPTGAGNIVGTFDVGGVRYRVEFESDEV